MRKLILMGRVAAGKTTLTQALRGEQLHYCKTQYINYTDTIIDTPAEIADIARFANTLYGVRELHLLPYHRLGQDKYAGIGRTYSLPDILPPPDAHMLTLKAAAEQAASGLHVQIGG